MNVPNAGIVHRTHTCSGTPSGLSSTTMTSTSTPRCEYTLSDGFEHQVRSRRYVAMTTLTSTWVAAAEVMVRTMNGARDLRCAIRQRLS